MITTAIIAEYNPFHNGHLYQLKKAKELTNCDHIVSIMSGNFVQRGEASLINKFDRAFLSVMMGIDLCLELPFCYATGSAHDFAYGAVSILNSLNCIDYICFGAETDDIDLLKEIAQIILDEPILYKNILKDNLAKGVSFPKARHIAIANVLGDNAKIDDILKQPNNILAIEYLCALSFFKSKIKPIIIKRFGANYHDTSINGEFASASAIRDEIINCGISSKVTNAIPDTIHDYFINSFKINYPCVTDDLLTYIRSLYFKSTLRDYCDFNIDLENKFKNANSFCTYDEFINQLSSKDITQSRIKRAILHAIIGYTNENRNSFIENNYSFYASILSFRKNSSELIKHIKVSSDIPIITKKADFTKELNQYTQLNSSLAQRMWQLDSNATFLFNQLIYNRYNKILPNDYQKNIPII